MELTINSVHGTWVSEITSEAITSDITSLSELFVCGEELFWLESRPQEAGRTTLIRQTGNSLEELTPPPYNVRSRVHEYGGCSYFVSGGKVFFVNFSDQNIYQIDIEPGSACRILQITRSDENTRFADFQYHKSENCLICVQEHHDTEVQNTLVSVDLGSGTATTLVGGHDFYSTPRLSPSNAQLAYLAWNQPNMPWDSTVLYLADVSTADKLCNANIVAGGDRVSVCQPEWLDAQTLIYSSDESGWWNLKQYVSGSITELYPEEAEYGLPHWVFGMRFYSILLNNKLACVRIIKGESRICLLDLNTSELTKVDTPHWQQFSSIQARGDSIICLAGNPDHATSIIQIDQSGTGTQSISILHKSQSPDFNIDWFSTGYAISFINRDGLSSYGFFYPPVNPQQCAQQGACSTGLPPLLVLSHGGPTDSVRRNMNLRIQYYTSRGWAVYDSNYAGSTGFGRDYRNRLVGNWGLADVADCEDAVAYLADNDMVDRTRVAIKGGSAGGYTTLAALTFTNCFKAGASHYGIGDLEALARDTHKFEARYLDQLVGAYPRDLDTFIARSPIHHTNGLSCPVIFFQGLDDKVVPPNQAEAMVDALKRKGVPVAYIPFAGEGHGFRRAENIKRSIESEYAFFAMIFEFSPADDLPDVDLQ